MIRLRALPVLLALLLAAAPPAGARPVTVLPPYDPGAIGYEPRLVTLPACGFALGLDPLWTVTEGRPGKTAAFTQRYDKAASSRRDRHPLHPATVTPLVSLTVDCATKAAPKKSVEAYLDRWGEGFIAGMSQGGAALATPVIDTVQLPDGPWRRVVLRTRQQGQPATWIFLMADRAGRSRSILLQISEDEAQGKLLAAGSDVRIGLPDQGETSTRLLAPARQLRGQSGHYLRHARSARENVELAMRIVSTLR